MKNSDSTSDMLINETSAHTRKPIQLWVELSWLLISFSSLLIVIYVSSLLSLSLFFSYLFFIICIIFSIDSIISIISIAIIHCRQPCVVITRKTYLYSFLLRKSMVNNNQEIKFRLILHIEYLKSVKDIRYFNSFLRCRVQVWTST